MSLLPSSHIISHILYTQREDAISATPSENPAPNTCWPQSNKIKKKRGREREGLKLYATTRGTIIIAIIYCATIVASAVEVTELF